MFKKIFFPILFICSVALAQSVHYKLLDIDNLELDANTLSTTNTNGNLLLSPNGTGRVDLKNGLSTGYIIAQSTVKLQNLAGSKALQTDASKNLTESTVTSTELGYLSGVTSAIQTQINALSGAGSSAITALTGDVTATGPGSVAATIANSAVTASKLATGIINNLFVANGASIAFAKLADLTPSQILVGNASSIATAVTMTGNVTLSNAGVATIANSVVTSAMISDGTIVNTDIAAGASIAYNKLANLTSANILVGNGSNVATVTAVTGDVTITNGGVTAVGSGKITSAMMANMGQSTVKGRSAGAITGVPVDLTNTELTALLNSFTATLKGVVPPPGSTTGKFLRDDSTWQTVTASGSGTGQKNYIANPDAETALTTGWATYADAAGTSPVDGTAGSPSITFAASTAATVLRGTNSFLETKGASNRQGDGVSYDFTIDAADKAKVLTISFDYSIFSGTYADGDLKLFIYDVTNANLIPVAGNSILKITTGSSYKQIATFQTASNSTSYRFIIHTVSTSASAYVVQFDNFILGPASMTTGAPRSDWTAYTPTFVGFGTLTGVNFFWARDGQDILIKGYATSGTMTGSVGSFSLPAGLTTADSTIIPGIQPSGIWQRDSTGAPAQLQTLLYNSSSTTVNFGFLASGTSGFTAQVASAIVGSSERFSVEDLRIPITGWSSNVAMSNDTDTRVVSWTGAIGSGQTLTSGVTNLNLTTLKDSHGAWNGSQYTVPVPGDYVISGSINENTTTPTWGVYVDGSLYNNATFGSQFTAGASSGGSALISGLKAGQLISLRCNASCTVGSAYIGIWRLSGPAQVAATESVNARYYASGTSLSGSLATVNWTTKDFDSHSAMASGLYTCPINGKYFVEAALGISGTFALNSTTVLEAQKTSTAICSKTNYAGGIITNSDISIACTINCLAGEVIRLQASSSATGPAIVSSNFRNWASIIRVGN